MTETKHPAKFHDEVLDEIAKHCDPSWSVLDPFAGTGRIHLLAERGFVHATVGVEIEPEWAHQHPNTIVGDALQIDHLFPHEAFDAIITSPCLAQGHRILTSDLRWVTAGDIEVGDEVMAFDAEAPGVTILGRASRRKWRRATVVRSVPRRTRCMRIVLANGDEVITTPEHPWLTERYAYSGHNAEWIESRLLMGIPPRQGGCGSGRGWKAGMRQPFFVLRQVEPWTQRTSFDAGWLSGMFDGEGSLSLGVHGAPKMMVCQVLGPVLDRAERVMADLGYGPNRIVRVNTPQAHYQKIANLYVTGGFPGLMRALGELRPTRLLEKWEHLDLSTRTIQPEKVSVETVEDAGVREIQEIETSTGTYIGEGYLHHNCFGNRMADHHNALERCKNCHGSPLLPVPCPKCNGTGFRSYKRITYKHQLGRDPHPHSSAILQWGDRYRAFHAMAWYKVLRLLRHGGTFILNIKDHPRGGVIQPVTAWHMETLSTLGLDFEDMVIVKTPGMRFGAHLHDEQQNEPEFVIVMRKP